MQQMIKFLNSFPMTYLRASNVTTKDLFLPLTSSLLTQSTRSTTLINVDSHTHTHTHTNLSRENAETTSLIGGNNECQSDDSSSDLWHKNKTRSLSMTEWRDECNRNATNAVPIALFVSLFDSDREVAIVF